MSIKEDCLRIIGIQRRFRMILDDPAHTAADEIQLGIEFFDFLSKNPISLQLDTVRKVATRQMAYFEQKYKRDGIWESLGDLPDPLDPTNQLFHHMIDVQLYLLEREAHQKI